MPNGLVATEGTEEQQNDISVLQLEEQVDVKEGNISTDYELDIDYEPERTHPYDKTVIQEEEEENSNEEYVKMVLPCQGTPRQRTMHHNVQDRNWHVCAAQRTKIMALWLQDIDLQLGCSPKSASLLVRK